MDILDSIILSFVQGISEFLPISSTGHLILTQWLLKMEQSEFLKSFDIIIQCGSILAVIVLYWRVLLKNMEVLKRIVIAFLPTSILGIIFYKIIKQYLLGNEKIVLWSLFLGGIALIIFEVYYREKKDAHEELSTISYKNAFIIGLFQAIAMIPGVSRSAATIIGGLVLGLKRKTIVEFSFILAVPTMLAATGLDLMKSWQNFSASQWDFLIVGFFTSFVVALAAIKSFLNFIKRYNFIPFGVYRLILALVFWLLILYK